MPDHATLHADHVACHAWRIPGYIWLPDERQQRARFGEPLSDFHFTTAQAALDALEAYVRALADERNPCLCDAGLPYRWREHDRWVDKFDEFHRLGCKVHDEECRIVDGTPIVVTRDDHAVRFELTGQWRWRAKRRETTEIDGVKYQAVTESLVPVSDWLPPNGYPMRGTMAVDRCPILLAGNLADLQRIVTDPSPENT